MFAYRMNALVLILSVTMLGCWIRRNENYCKGRNDNNNCSEPPYPDAAPPSCPDEVTCSGATGVCNTDTGQCVMCTKNDHCTGNTPVCGIDNVCRGCAAHSECGTSEACLPEGRCANSGEVAYVREGGAGDCTKDSPCGSLSTAIGKGQTYIKVTGTIVDNLFLKDDKTVTILADSKAKLQGAPMGDSLIEVRDTVHLSIYDLELLGATGSPAHAIYVSNGKPTVSLHHVNIHNNDGAGISTSGGTLDVFRSRIANNQGGGISMNSATTFDIRNNFIVKNGSPTSKVGGVLADPAAGSKLEFNTIVGNKANDVTSGGIVCSQANVSVPRNLIFDNTGLVAQTSIGCVVGDSRVTNPGANFSSDYHLTVDTPAGPGGIRDVVPCASAPDFVDIDGEIRPKNGMCDLGADEY